MSIESITAANQATNTADSALSSLSSDLDNFLVILTTQLQNQDPLSPMDSNEFTNQLVQFANVEQSISQTQKLEELINLQQTSELTSAVGFMGQDVKVDHNEFSLEDGATVDLEYTLPSEAKTAALFVMNDAGNIVFSTPVETTTGTHGYTWDAKDGSGNPMPAGNYFFEVRAVDENSAEIDDLTYAYTGHVNAVEYGAESTNLRVGTVEVDMSKVISVVKPVTAVTANDTSETDTNDSSETTEEETTEETTDTTDSSTTSDESGESETTSDETTTTS